jgi:predicted nucleic-acid-binding Zn-ribbon protein
LEVSYQIPDIRKTIKTIFPASGIWSERTEMEDIKLLEKCPSCQENLTLMESIRVDPPDRKTIMDGQTFLVKRCLKCGGYPCEEVVAVYDSEDDYAGDMRLIDELLKGEYKHKFGARINKICTKDVIFGVGFCWYGGQRFITITLLKWTFEVGIVAKWYPAPQKD